MKINRTAGTIRLEPDKSQYDSIIVKKYGGIKEATIAIRRSLGMLVLNNRAMNKKITKKMRDESI